MTSGQRPDATPGLRAAPWRARWIDRRQALALLLAGAVPSLHAQPAFDLRQLMALLAQVQAGEATFTEVRHSSVLDRPLESTGRLSFQAPDRFVRETLKPRSESLAVDGNTLTMRQGSRSRTLQLDSVPEAAVIVEAVRGTLTGNREAIERHFDAQVSGAPAKWTLLLAPRAARLRELVTQIAVTGQQAMLREITVSMTGGDYSIMKIQAK
jgi:outer membrane lipoprotein-sorting protein